MSEAIESASEEEICQTISSVAFEKFIERCGNPEARRKAMNSMMGLDEPDVDCRAALREGLNEETLNNFRGVRQWVTCRVFNDTPSGDEALLEAHDGDLEAAFEDAWSRVDDARD